MGQQPARKPTQGPVQVILLKSTTSSKVRSAVAEGLRGMEERSSSEGIGHERKHSQLSSAPQTLLSPKSRTTLLLATGQTFGALQQSGQGYYIRTKEEAINNIYSQYTISFIIYPSQFCAVYIIIKQRGKLGFPGV